MKWINVNEKYLNYLRAFEGRIPRTDYGSDKYKPFFGILFETEDFYYITQVSVKPPTFVMFVNDKQLTHFSYTRYIENKIREAFGFRGTSIRFINRERKEKD